MISKWRFLLARVLRQLWLRAALYALLGVATALVSLVAGPYLERSGFEAWSVTDAVTDLLTIMASSMLVVATFSLQTMVSAYAAAANHTTPRATQLLIEDRTAQRALSTFIGAFLFSIVGMISIASGAYEHAGRAVLFGVTVLMIAWVVITLLRWVHHLVGFGRVPEIINRVEAATREALLERARHPRLGGAPASAPAAGARPLSAPSIGYVRMVDVALLQKLADRHDLQIQVAVLPGTYVEAGRPLCWVDGRCEPRLEDQLAAAFLIGDGRTFEQDPRFGLIVLAEIASRGLSPATNDPGTAIDVLGTVVRLLSEWARAARQASGELLYPRVGVPALAMAEVLDDVFNPIARDGAQMLEVQLRLQRALSALAALGEPELAAAAQRHSTMARQRALAALALEDDRLRLEREIAQRPALLPPAPEA